MRNTQSSLPESRIFRRYRASVFNFLGCCIRRQSIYLDDAGGGNHANAHQRNSELDFLAEKMTLASGTNLGLTKSSQEWSDLMSFEIYPVVTDENMAKFFI
jgi:hypothetical protein